MRQERFGDLDVVLAGGADREGGGDGPLVVLLHGFGAPGTDLVGLWRVLDVPSSVRFAFPAAPLVIPGYGGGRAWWMIDIEAMQRAMMGGQSIDRSDDDPEGLRLARAQVEATLDALRAKLAPPKLVLGGFSQGAMVSCDLALRTAQPLDGLVLWSGTLLARTKWEAAAPSRQGLPVVQSHGQQDPLLPFSQAERLRDLLVAGGVKVDFVPFRGGHEIPERVLERAGALISGV